MTVSGLDFLLICLAGGVGSMFRASLAAGLSRKLEAETAILLINALGSALAGAALGVVFGSVAEMRAEVLPLGFALFAIGLLGGVTTVSTFALQILQLWHGGKQGKAVRLSIGAVVMCPAFAGLGLIMALIFVGMG